MWQTASDFIVFIGWLWDNISFLLRNIFLPIRYIFTFLKEFFANVFASPIIPEEIWTFNSQIKEVFASIPYFDVLMSVAVSGILILMIIFILKQFLKV